LFEQPALLKIPALINITLQKFSIGFSAFPITFLGVGIDNF